MLFTSVSARPRCGGILCTERFRRCAVLSTERPCVSRSRSPARLWLSFAAPATSVAESSEAVLDKDRLFAIKRGGSVGGWSWFDGLRLQISEGRGLAELLLVMELDYSATR